ncbi:MAG TPA: HEAT repeat domain-containing protein [Gemmatimonadaceae bacterium]|nr:HEAT repeat domain-containing protein [Gemmatimonadaceae bacterium]
MSIQSAVPFAADILLRVTLVLGVFGAAGYLLRGQSAAVRHLLWSLATAGCVVLPAISAVNPYTVAVLPARAAPAATEQVRQDRFARLDDAKPTVREATNPGATRPVDDAPAPTPINWIAVLLLVWLGGTLAYLLRFVTGIAVIRGFVARAVEASPEWTGQVRILAARFGVRRPLRVVLSDDAEMPFAFGLRTPVIVLPASALDWTDERREAVLMHELAHFSRGDILMNALSQIARALYWFHPLAWLAAHRLRVEGERASDDVVLRGGALASDYAEHLLAIVRSFGRPLPAPALAMARRSEFEGRLLAILEPRERRALSRGRTIAMAAIALAVMLPLSAVSSTARAATATTGITRAGALAQDETPAPPKPASRESASPQTPARVPTREQAPSAPAGSTIAALIETLADANGEVRLAAVKALGSLEDPAAIAALAKALREDSDPRVREAAAWALGEIDDARAVPSLLDALKSERVAAVRQQIVHALGEIDDASAVAGISGAAKDASASVRREVAWALGELGDPSAVPALVSMAKDDDTEVRRNVAQALNDVKGESAFDTLVSMAHDTDAEVRSSAVNALGDLEDRRTLPTLIDALKDSNADVRSHAADGIQEIPDIKTAPRALIDALADANADVRQNVANALGEIGDDAAVPALKKATTDPNADVRRAAAEALSEIGGPEAVTALIALLKDPDPEIRKIAVEALGKRR